MKLVTAHVTEFQSVRDSGEFSIADITCLVGKNEAGKSALLQAIYRLNPIVPSEGALKVTHDYPRSDVAAYGRQVDAGERPHAVVIKARFELESKDIAAIEATVGKDVVRGATLTVSKGYENTLGFDLEVDEKRAIQNALNDLELLSELRANVEAADDVYSAKLLLDEAELTGAVQVARESIDRFAEAGGVRSFLVETVLRDKLPKFLYFDEYYQMKGRANIERLIERMKEDRPEPSDHPLVGLIHLAGLRIEDLLTVGETRELKNQLEGAGNELTKNVVKYWSQNRHLDLRFDVRQAAPKDPEGMQSGTNIWGEVYDSRHKVTTELGTRSRGFVWFFSFLAWYADVKSQGDQVIILLDEPGLSLHAKAQEDLLRYFDAEVAGNHQLIYSTHSPFMVDPTRFDRVRIVQDRGVDSVHEIPPDEDGTKVFVNVLDASADTLFPLQGALGYEIYQTLFIGPNCLVVEGVSDLLYLQGMSAVLETAGRDTLRKDWTITPVGGSGKVPTFVALIGAQSTLNLAVLIDFQKRDQQEIEALYKRKLLKKKNVLTFADFTKTKEADIEDMFDVDFYVDLVNQEYRSTLAAPITVGDLDPNLPRVLQRIEKYFADKGLGEFSHFRPSRYFSENIGLLSPSISAATLTRFEDVAKQLNGLLPR